MLVFSCFGALQFGCLIVSLCCLLFSSLVVALFRWFASSLLSSFVVLCSRFVLFVQFVCCFGCLVALLFSCFVAWLFVCLGGLVVLLLSCLVVLLFS